MQPKKILMLVHAPQTRPGHLNWVALRDLVRGKMPDTIVEMSAFSELALVLDGDKTRIYDTRQQFDVADFDLVVIRTLYGQLETAIAVAAYCRKKGIPYIDQYVPGIGNGKLSCAFVRWEHDLSVPPTAYGSAEAMISLARGADLGWPLVVKADNGKKGKDNYLVHDVTELQQILDENPDIHFVMQSFISNKGDYRILVFNGKARMAILRKAGHGSHLNNTSQGGSAEVVPLEDIPAALLELAVRASDIERLAVAGADIIIDAITGRPYILEVNRAPQIATGANADDKVQQYALALREILEQGITKGILR